MFRRRSIGPNPNSMSSVDASTFGSRAGPFIAITHSDSESTQETWQIEPTDPIPRIINVETGMIIHALRSSLDLLANVLAARNGYAGSKDVYFPVCDKKANWTVKHGGAEKIRRLSDSHIATIESLQPYHGRDCGRLLSELHHMDITRKHRALVGFEVKTPGMLVIRPDSFSEPLASMFPQSA